MEDRRKEHELNTEQGPPDASGVTQSDIKLPRRPPEGEKSKENGTTTP